MWKCDRCGETFDETEIVTKRSGYHSDYIGHGGDYWEEEGHCPYCGSEDIDEAKKCDLCGDYGFSDDFVYYDDFSVCPDCNDKLHGIAKAVVEDTTGEFEEIDSVQARDLLIAYLSEY